MSKEHSQKRNQEQEKSAWMFASMHGRLQMRAIEDNEQAKITQYRTEKENTKKITYNFLTKIGTL